MQKTGDQNTDLADTGAKKTRERRHKIDAEWFRQRLEANRQSQADLAKHLGLHRSQVSQLLAGRRGMKMEEATQIANFLREPVSIVLKHAGVAIDLDGQPTRVLLAAIINEKGEVERLAESRPLPQSVIDRAQAAINVHGNGRIIAAQVRALEGPLAVLDDAVVLFKPTDGVDISAIGVLSICRNHAGAQVMVKIERARKTGEARVVCVSGKVTEFDLQTATPVLAIIP